MSFFVVTFCLRNQVAGLGSDSFHHTLITQLIIWNRGIPNDYSPAYPEIVTLNYHLGFHIVSAVLALLSGWETRLVVLIMLPLLVIGSGFALYYFIAERSDDNYVSLYSAIIPMFLVAFPIGMLEWGRYPQTLGLAFLVIFLSEYLKKMGKPLTRGYTFSLAALASTIVYTHYRVSIMSIFGIFVWEIGNFLFRENRIYYKIRIANLLKISIACFIMILPLTLSWLKSISIGYSDPLQLPSGSFFELSRLGDQNINYLPHLIVITLLIPSIFGIFINKDRVGFWVLIWWGSMIFLSMLLKDIFLYNIDPITLWCSLYIPIGIIIGVGLPWVISQTPKVFQIFLFLIIVSIGGWFTFLKLEKTIPSSAYVSIDDISASKWIKNHISSDSCFMINTFNFDFASNFIIGSDGGWWLPLLAQRCVITYPMTTNIEKFDRPNALTKTISLHRLRGDLDNVTALELLKKYNIHYVYTTTNRKIGGSFIDPNELSKSSNFKLIYKNRSVYVFEVTY